MLICGTLYAATMGTFGVLSTLARIRIGKQILNLRTRGVYEDWKRKNHAILVFERTLIIVFCVSFACIIVLPFWNAEISRFAFIPFVGSAALAPLSLYWHYRAIMKG
jgi:hypothetical protein